MLVNRLSLHSTLTVDIRRNDRRARYAIGLLVLTNLIEFNGFAVSILERAPDMGWKNTPHIRDNMCALCEVKVATVWCKDCDKKFCAKCPHKK